MTMTPFERRAVWLSTGATLVTGVAYWWMKEMMTPSEPWAVVNHPLQPWVLKAHILAAPALVFSVGLVTSQHIWRHFRTAVRKGRWSGLAAAMTFVLMVVTGYALQVVTAELIMDVLAWSHLLLGIVYSLGVAVHWPATRRRPARGTEDSAGSSATPSTAGRAAVPGPNPRRRSAGRPQREEVQG